LVNSVIVEEMHKKRLGNSDMELTPIGVARGRWAAVDMFAGPGDAESISAIHAALDHGVNWTRPRSTAQHLRKWWREPW
jgi:hypothetical protein